MNAFPRSFFSLAPAVFKALLLFAAVATFAMPASAAPFTPADEKAVRAVVEGQLAAFEKDDANKAYAYAGANVREAVGNAEGFLDMVKRGYPVVYRHTAVAFLKAEGKDDKVVQRVQMTDAEGTSWLATYTLERQKGKPWRITGCQLAENKGRMA